MNVLLLHEKTSAERVKEKNSFIKNCKKVLKIIQTAVDSKNVYEGEIKKINSLFSEDFKREKISDLLENDIRRYENHLADAVIFSNGKDDVYFNQFYEIEERVKAEKAAKVEIFQELKIYLKDLLDNDNFNRDDFIRELRTGRRWKRGLQSIYTIYTEEIERLIAEEVEMATPEETNYADDSHPEDLEEEVPITNEQKRDFIEYLDKIL